LTFSLAFFAFLINHIPIQTTLCHASIGSHLLGGDFPAGYGLYIRMASHLDGQKVLAPIAPGFFQSVNVVEHRLLAPGEAVEIRSEEFCTLALDGEREHSLQPSSSLSLRLNANGPKVIDPRKAIEIAARAGVFLST